METSTPVKAIVLPTISITLQKAWEINKANLERAGVYEFILWITSVSQKCLEDEVTQFVCTYKMSSQKAIVNGKQVDFSEHTVGRLLKLPTEGLIGDKLPELAEEDIIEVFEGKFSQMKNKTWNLDAARYPWQAWLHFVNNYLLFQPQEKKMTQRAIVAALKTWKGQKINWAKMVKEKIHEEIIIRKVNNPPILCLYSGFYLSVLCQNTNSLDVINPYLLSSPLPSSLPSPQNLSTLGYHTKLEKIQSQVKELEKEVKAQTKLLGVAQEREISYIQQINTLQAELIICQAKNDKNDQIILLSEANAELAITNDTLLQMLRDLKGSGIEKFEVLNKSKKPPMCTVGTSTHPRDQQESSMFALPLTPSNPLPLGVCDKLWAREVMTPAAPNLYRAYEMDRDLFLISIGLKKGALIDHDQFHDIWSLGIKLGHENLVAEILARKDLHMSHPFSAFVTMGDMGARIFLYYSNLEEQQKNKQTIPPYRHDPRVVDWHDYDHQVTSDFYGQTSTVLDNWRQSLQRLLIIFQDEKLLPWMISSNLQRIIHMGKTTDFTASHYIFNYDCTLERLKRYIHALEVNQMPMIHLEDQVQFLIAPHGYQVRALQTIDIPVQGSANNIRYLGHYDRLFDQLLEHPIPTWHAIDWILEDYGQSRTEEVPADIVYKTTSLLWSFEPPPAVRMNPHFCPCQRRHKWSPTATINSIEYNWPRIPGNFSTPEGCRDAYGAFSEIHRQHVDPVCFRAAIYAGALSKFCNDWNFVINVNFFHPSRHEFLLLLKLRYRPARWIRLVEAMALTHFIEGAHLSLINEFPTTRCGPFERFLRWQRLNNPKLLENDEDLRREVEKLEIRDCREAAVGLSAKLHRPA